jgi:hypothetical protein
VGAAVGEDDLLHAGLHAMLGQAPRQLLAQALMAVGTAVLQQARAWLAGQLAQGAAQFVFRQPALRQPATTGLERILGGLQRLPGYPQRIDAAIQRRADFGQRQRRQVAADVEAGARRAAITPSAARRS